MTKQTDKQKANAQIFMAIHKFVKDTEGKPSWWRILLIIIGFIVGSCWFVWQLIQAMPSALPSGR